MANTSEDIESSENAGWNSLALKDLKKNQKQTTHAWQNENPK